MDSGAVSSGSQPKKRRGMALHTKILLGLLIGASVGIAANVAFRVPAGTAEAATLDANQNGISDRLEWWAEHVAEPLGRVFLRMVLMVVLPLVVSALMLGVLGLGDFSRLGRVGVTSLGFTVLLSGVAVTIGITLVNVVQPGRRLGEDQRQALQRAYEKDAATSVERAQLAKPLDQILLDLLPENPVQEMAGALDGSSKGDGMLAVMCFSLIAGAALSAVEESRRRPVVAVLEGLFDMSMVIIDWAMRIAPLGVACLMFSMTSRMGGGILITLLWFVLTVLAGLALQMFVVYPLLLRFYCRLKPWRFFRQIEDAIFTAFGTSSSNATLPTALRVSEENAKIPQEIGRFVLTVGSTANQNGTGLYEGVVVLFLAQVWGLELSLAQQLTVVLMAMLAGVGTAGVPGGSIPLIVVVLQTIGVPGQLVALILGVDRVLDMCRTTLNVTGDLTLAACVAASEERRQRRGRRVSA